MIFTSMDIKKQVNDLHNSEIDRITDGMTESEKKAYHLAMLNMNGCFDSVVNDDENMVVHCNGKTDISEESFSEGSKT